MKPQQPSARPMPSLQWLPSVAPRPGDLTHTHRVISFAVTRSRFLTQQKPRSLEGGDAVSDPKFSATLFSHKGLRGGDTRCSLAVGRFLLLLLLLLSVKENWSQRLQ